MARPLLFQPGMKRVELCRHALHLAIPTLALILVEHPVAVAAAAAVFFFAALLWLHDAMHGALGLRGRANDLVLALTGALTGVPGHGVRTLHLHHHARPLAEDDVEGWGGRVPMGRAALLGWLHFARMPAETWRRTPRAWRGWLVGEWLVVLTVALLVSAHWKGRVVLAVTLLLECTSSLWGAHLPHRVPPAVRKAVEALAFVRWPTLLSVLSHELHHRRPHLAAFELTTRWLEEPPREREPFGEERCPSAPSSRRRATASSSSMPPAWGRHMACSAASPSPSPSSRHRPRSIAEHAVGGGYGVRF